MSQPCTCKHCKTTIDGFWVGYTVNSILSRTTTTQVIMDGGIFCSNKCLADYLVGKTELKK